MKVKFCERGGPFGIGVYGGFFWKKNLVEIKNCIIFVENKKLKIMSRTIQEIQRYFDKRPELWAKINEELRIMRDEYFLNVDSLMAWAMDNVPDVCKRFGTERAVANVADILLNALSRIDARNLTPLPKEEYPMGEDGESVKYPVMVETLNANSLTKEFRAWFVGERQECEEAGFKGFNSDMTCRGFQYEVGKAYDVKGDVWMCDNGFHACKSPLDVLRCYGDIDSRYCIVKQWGYMDKLMGRTVSSNIRIENEISLKELFEIAVGKMGEVPYNKEFAVGEGDWKAVSSLPYWKAIEGMHSNIILREGTGGNSWVVGTENVIGIIRSNTEINISGYGNMIYIFGNGNTVNITGRGNNVRVIEGEGNTIVVSGDANEVLSRVKVNVVCTKRDNSVMAGSGSTVTFHDEERLRALLLTERR